MSFTFENYSLCRTCLADDGEMVCIYNTQSFDQVDIPICDLLRLSVSVQIDKGDGLPEQMCLRCVEELNRVVKFRKQCLKSDSLLKDYMSITKQAFQNARQVDSDDGITVESSSFIVSGIDDSKMETNTENVINDCIFDDTDPEPIEGTEDCDSEWLDAAQPQTKQKQKKRPRECHVCKKTFTNLTAHLLVHNDERPFLCSICGKAFRTQAVLEGHMLIHSEERPYECLSCDKAFKTVRVLRIHEATHATVKPFMCETCGKNFALRETLQVHLRLHSGKQYKCNGCDKVFGKYSTMKSHRRMHGLKRYKCELCGMCFSVNAALKKHRDSHLAEKRHTCELCDKRYKSAAYLKRHKKHHDDGRKCEGKVCQDSFAADHEQVHTGEKPFGCDECGINFDMYNDFRNHNMMHYPKQFT